MTEETKNLLLPKEKFTNLPNHQRVTFSALDLLSRDERVIGLYLSGSFADGQPDKYSDVDINILVEEVQREHIIKDHSRLIQQVGKVATVFPATHMHDPNQIIVFYEEAIPIHVDYQYRIASELTPKSKNKNVMIVLDRNGRLTSWKQECQKAEPEKPPLRERLQYFEDRFWGWCWYTDTKIERGEFWEARDAIEYVRSNVLIALAYFKLDLPNEGGRRIEKKFPKDMIDMLVKTVPSGLDKQSYKTALLGLIDGYKQLFQGVLDNNSSLQINEADRAYFIEAIKNPQ